MPRKRSFKEESELAAAQAIADNLAVKQGRKQPQAKKAVLDKSDPNYWFSRTPPRTLRHLEELRRKKYRANQRMQKVFKIITLDKL